MFLSTVTKLSVVTCVRKDGYLHWRCTEQLIYETATRQLFLNDILIHTYWQHKKRSSAKNILPIFWLPSLIRSHPIIHWKIPAPILKFYRFYETILRCQLGDLKMFRNFSVIVTECKFHLCLQSEINGCFQMSFRSIKFVPEKN